MIFFTKPFLSIALMTIAIAGNAQNKKAFNLKIDKLDNVQKSFAKQLSTAPINLKAKAMLLKFVTSETDSLQKAARDSKILLPEQKILSLNAQFNILDTLQQQVSKGQYDVNFTRLYIDRFKQLWQTLFTHKSYDEVLRPFRAKTAGMMAAVFRDFPGADRIKEIARLKYLLISLEKITNFLSNNPNFAFRDSLIFVCGNTVPENFINFAKNTKDEILQKAFREHPSKLIQTLLRIGKEPNAKVYLPFAILLSENRITLEDIEKIRLQPLPFYQLLVDAELFNRSRTLDGSSPLYVQPTRNYLKKYALIFFAEPINSLHEQSAEKNRFFVLDGLRPQDLYFIIISCESNLYTSSYLYTYKKLMTAFDESGYDSLFRLVKYDQYEKFLNMAGRYNTLSSFMKKMPTDSCITIIRRLMYGLEKNEELSLKETINVAETLPGIVQDRYLDSLITEAIRINYTRCANLPNTYGMNIYTVLTDIYEVVRKSEYNNLKKTIPELDIYFKVQHISLGGLSGRINQMALFYGDEDGRSSYASFMTSFTDTKKWAIEKKAKWVIIRSKKGFPITIFANLPLTEDNDEDKLAQEALAQFLESEQIKPSILIHRGHSYHLANSLKYVIPETRLAILGSCGGYTEIFELLQKSPDAQVISTKQVGSRLVNEPIIKLMNDLLLAQKDLDWTPMWKTLEGQFKTNKQANEYFIEYVPPYKNISLLVAALFMQRGME
ncbi:MAG: hypothetical protein IPP31_12960 [Chitinophagaceae bacterium]|nr:hypothetical protein [Chitinophagaceae bacterium]